MGTSRRKAALLGPEVEGHWAWLADRGYTSQTVRGMLKHVGQVGRWQQQLLLAITRQEDLRHARIVLTAWDRTIRFCATASDAEKSGDPALSEVELHVGRAFAAAHPNRG